MKTTPNPSLKSIILCRGPTAPPYSRNNKEVKKFEFYKF